VGIITLHAYSPPQNAVKASQPRYVASEIQNYIFFCEYKNTKENLTHLNYIQHAIL